MSLVERGEFERRLLAEAKARRAKFFSPPMVENKVDRKVVELVPMVVRSPYEDVMDLMIAAVGNAAGLPVNEIISGPITGDVVNARRLAMALSMIRCGITPSIVAKHFGVPTDAVRDAAKELTPIWRFNTFSSNTPIERTLVNLWPIWILERENSRCPTILDIQNAVSEAFGIRRHDMIGKCRTQKLVVPRQVAMALCKALTLHSLPEIGRRFNRDHTCVLAAVRRKEPMLHIACEILTPRHHVAEWAQAMKSLHDHGFIKLEVTGESRTQA